MLIRCIIFSLISIILSAAQKLVIADADIFFEYITEFNSRKFISEDCVRMPEYSSVCNLRGAHIGLL